ncbi:MAG: MFS transporter, partial [Chloroflexota bacterium]
MLKEFRKTTQRVGLPSSGALQFIVLLGIVSLFADMTYEGARSITGPFLGILGASATVVGIVAGFGELVGYGLRLVSGYVADRTQRYWTITMVGYAINLLAVPLLALAGRWEVAALFIILERTGKAMRNPPRDAMLSHATSQVGRGWGFGLHEALDQVGAVLGPLLVAGILALQGDYRPAFAVLGLSALAALALLVAARLSYPTPRDFEAKSELAVDGAFPRS